jgi:hypothetical protein
MSTPLGSRARVLRCPISIRSTIKRTVMRGYNHGFIDGKTVLRLFARFDLWSA